MKFLMGLHDAYTNARGQNFTSIKFYAPNNNRNMNWIFDTGATDHMVHSVDLLTTKFSISNRLVRLPNGVTALVMYIGDD